MDTGNMGGTIRGLSPIAGAAGTGLNNARSGSNRPKPNSAGPWTAQTPQEALTYIDLLYKTGRTGDLAAILRRSEVFREAWLILQRSFAAHLETSEEPGRANWEGASDPKCLPAAAMPPESVNIPHPAGKLTYTLAQALHIYQSRRDYYDQERDAKFRISIRV